MSYIKITADSLIKELWRNAVYENLRYNCSRNGGYHIGQTDPNPIFGDKPDYRYAKVSHEELCALLSSTAWGSIDHLCPKVGGRFSFTDIQYAAEWLAENKGRFLANPTRPEFWGNVFAE
jgi:hypothetical protein